MAEATQLVFSHKEVATALVKAHGLHAGVWGLYVKFGITGANVGMTPTEINPAAIVPILELGLQKFEEENNISVDAAKVNPADTTTPHAIRPEFAKRMAESMKEESKK